MLASSMTHDKHRAIADYAGKLYFSTVTLADVSDTMEVMHADCVMIMRSNWHQ